MTSPEGLKIKDPCANCIYRNESSQTIGALVLASNELEETVLPGCRHPWRIMHQNDMSPDLIAEAIRGRGKQPQDYGIDE